MTIVPDSVGTRRRLDTPDPVDVVGERVLLALQTVNISRLSTHPVPIVPGTLLVVAGQGPKDSNGAGKSSFIAAITALLGDEQWRFASGAKTIAELLFNAELAAQGDSQWASADHGYIAGVFGDPTTATEPTAGTEPTARTDATDGADNGDGAAALVGSSALTVWLRVNLTAPHLEIRWSDGVQLAAAASESERVALADKIWDSLPRSAGRRDYLAKDLGRVLYGQRVRCVSFLSTSVRSRVATNLLSQPLNELSPERIFSAIAALTGLDRELEAERKLRADEHAERVRAAEALERLQTWEAETAALLRTFDRRDEARGQLRTAREHWRSRLAQRLVDGCEADRSVGAELEVERQRIEDATGAIKALNTEITQLRDDDLDHQVAEAERAEAEVRAELDELGRERAVTEAAADELRQRATELAETSRESDGRDVATAEQELAEAQRSRDATRERLGAAKERLSRAQSTLRAAHAGESGTPEQLAALEQAGVDAVGLIDVLELDEAVRARWEATLWPYHEAIAVPSGQLDAAVAALADLPGSIVVPTEHLPDDHDLDAASPTDDPGDDPGDGPTGVRTAYQLARFLHALDRRTTEQAEPVRVTDAETGVVVVGGFADPITGRAARVRSAGLAADTARTDLDDAQDEADRAERAYQRASARLAGARAAETTAGVDQQIRDKRARLATVNEQLEALTPRMNEAVNHHRAVRARAENRDAHIELHTKEKQRHENTRHAARQRAAELTERREGLRLDERHADWGGTEASAQEWLDNLGTSGTEHDWHREAQLALDRALQGAFPEGTADPEVPDQVRLLLERRESGEGSRAEREVHTFANLAEGLGSRLRDWEEYERQNRAQIESQRDERRLDFEAARKGVAEAANAAEVGRSTVTTAIRARLTKVAEHLDRLDLAYGGYGATLEFPTPQPPADPEQDWRWRVTPKWRRSEGHGHVAYNRRANTALMDEKAVKLVCAAALASAGGSHLCLVLDELGRNLGKEHRREAVALFRQIGETHGITVIGALQDDMEPYAIDACGEYVKLRRGSDAMPYNEPPVVVAHDEHAERVRLLAEAVSHPRSPATDES